MTSATRESSGMPLISTSCSPSCCCSWLVQLRTAAGVKRAAGVRFFDELLDPPQALFAGDDLAVEVAGAVRCECPQDRHEVVEKQRGLATLAADGNPLLVVSPAFGRPADHDVVLVRDKRTRSEYAKAPPGAASFPEWSRPSANRFETSFSSRVSETSRSELAARRSVLRSASRARCPKELERRGPFS